MQCCVHQRLHRLARPCYVSWSAHCFPGARVLDVSAQILRDPEVQRIGRAARGWMTPSCSRRRHWTGTSGAWSRWYAAHRPRRRSSCQDLVPRLSSLFALNEWLLSWCKNQKLLFVNNWNLFWEHPRLFRADSLHPQQSRAELLSDNISRKLCSIWLVSQNNSY